jgi:diguanylate cyclase (GGDEF)-like protein
LVQNINLELLDFLMTEIAVVDLNGAIVYYNQKWKDTARIGGLLPKKQGWNYITECEVAIERGSTETIKILGGLRQVLADGRPFFVGTYACPFEGRHHWFQVQITPFEYCGKLHAILMHVDVSELQRDSLTGLPNRAMFDAQFDLALSSARDGGRRTGVVVVDMNGLKLINDLHGHRAGDEALIALAEEVKKAAEPNSMAARIGGDEFGVVLSANYDVLSAWRMRARFKSGISCTIPSAGNSYRCLPASEWRFIQMTAKPPATFLRQPIKRCTRVSAANR